MGTIWSLLIAPSSCGELIADRFTTDHLVSPLDGFASEILNLK